jgi:hypothetical protein
MEGKVCTKCNEIKLLSEFYMNGSRLRSECKVTVKCNQRLAGEGVTKSTISYPWLQPKPKNHYTNLQFLYPEDNNAKSNSLT